MQFLINYFSMGKQIKPIFELMAARAFSASTGEIIPTVTSVEHFDIIIGGGGLVGTTLAASLASKRTLSDKRILLLEGAPPFKGFNINQPYGNRVSAINKKSIALFESIGAWKQMANARTKPVKQMQVWESNSEALIQFQHEHFAEDVACIIENDLILDAVYNQLKEKSPNVVVRNLSRISKVNLPKGTGKAISEVTLESGEKFSCELIIGADGANSLIRKEMNVDVFSLNYERMGLVATLELSEAADNSVAWQRFIPSGPVALLPLTDKLSSLVWSTTIKHAKELLSMPPNVFVDALNEAFCKEYSKNALAEKAISTLNSIMGRHLSSNRQYPPRVAAVLEKSRATFPLGFLHASSYISSGAALIGDAAHRIHPLAGQGVNLGFSDVIHLTDTLTQAVYAGAKLGDKQYLIEYERKCLKKNLPIMLGVHGLHTLYSTEITPVVLLRSLGLQFTHNVPQIKDIFMQKAMG